MPLPSLMRKKDGSLQTADSCFRKQKAVLRRQIKNGKQNAIFQRIVILLEGKRIYLTNRKV
jgi:hypothetical protein